MNHEETHQTNPMAPWDPLDALLIPRDPLDPQDLESISRTFLEQFALVFKNPTTGLRVVWGLTEKKCEQTPKFACFSV